MVALRWSVVCCAMSLVLLPVSASRAERRVCPSGMRPALAGCVEGAARAKFRQTPEARRVTLEPRVRTPDLVAEEQRDPEHKLQKRSDRLLVRELQGLERLLKVTPPKSPDRAALIRRLAEGYAELAKQAELARIRAELELEQAERNPPPKRAPAPYPSRL